MCGISKLIDRFELRCMKWIPFHKNILEPPCPEAFLFLHFLILRINVSFILTQGEIFLDFRDKKK